MLHICARCGCNTMHSGNTAATTMARCARQPSALCRRLPTRLTTTTTTTAPRHFTGSSSTQSSCSTATVNTTSSSRKACQLGNNRQHHRPTPVSPLRDSGASTGMCGRSCRPYCSSFAGSGFGFKIRRPAQFWSARSIRSASVVGRSMSGLVLECENGASEAGGTGLGTGGRARGMSSFLADALRETATNHGIDKICNGSSACVDDPTVEVKDFIYDIDFGQRPSRRHQPLVDAPDPFELVASDLGGLSDGIKSLIGTDHPVLNAAAKYFFELDGGKKIRPTMVILMSHACNSHAKDLRPSGSLSPSQHERQARHEVLQLRLAEITEMIHAASLFHDDVIDEADTRRGVSSVNKVFGNKLAILAGDFLLARSSMSLARLRSLESVELMSAAIEHLVKGEVLQMRPTENGGGAFEYYVRKNYYKTGSLMANSCKAAAVLGDHHVEVQEVAFEYGKRVGLAFQLVDDILDFEGNAFTLGKPALNDLRQGLATAPVLLAAEQQVGLDKLIKRKFRGPGDVDEALALVHASDGIARARDVAVVQAEKAMDAVLTLRQSPARDALVQLAHKIVNRNH